MSLPLSAGTWTLDPTHSQVGFGVRHLGISTLQGRFGTVDATLQVGDDAASSSLTAEIDLSSVDTGNADRDGHLRASDFFDVEAKPKMTFASTSISPNGDAWTVAGDLALNGQTQVVELAVTMFGTEDNPFDGSHRAGFRPPDSSIAPHSASTGRSR